ncbi:hypothetical protein ACNQR7_32435 [Mycolicibacterium senegalense]|uniref:hypothetical protein n=1 Tax=Mycolicibacterium senegalense TaxID=1796 RepID=UPI003AABDEB2
MNGQDLPGALHARNTLLSIASDPDLTQSAKLFAFCLLAYLTGPEYRTKKRTGKARHWAEVVGEMMDATAVGHTVLGVDMAQWQVIDVISKDIPRYEVPFERVRCGAPKVRGPNAGQPCGRNANGGQWIDRDPMSGEGTRIGYCRDHYTNAVRIWQQERYDSWVAHGRPSPPANKGGILARHFDANWPKLYAWADPTQEPLPQGKPANPPRPKLKLIRGSATP